MAQRQFRGSNQIMDSTIPLSKLVSDFLSGSDWNITNSANNAVITGLGSPSLANDAVNKAYVDGLVDSNLKSPDGFATDASANYPSDYKSSGVVSEGDTFYITSIASGTLCGTETVNVGDLLVALVDTPGNTDANWAILESNRDQATETVLGVAKIATQSIADAGTNDTDFVTPLKLSTYLVNAGIAPGQAQNGLTQNGNFVELGGTLIKNTVVSGAQRLDFSSSDGANSSFGLTLDEANYNAKLSGSAIGNTLNYIEANSSTVVLVADDNQSGSGTGISKIEVKPGSSEWIEVSTASNNGMKYLADYSANNATNDRWIVDKSYVDTAVAGVVLPVAGAGITDNAGTYDVVATDLSILVGANDLGVNIGTTNGTSLEVSATGLELPTTITGARTFSDAVTLGVYTLPIVDGTSGQILKTDGAGAVTWQDDGQSKIVQQAPESADLAADLASGNVVHTLSNLGTHATVKVTNVQLFYNGQKQRITADYTIDALTGAITILFDAYTGDSFDFEYNIQNA